VKPGAGIADQSGVCLDPCQGMFVHRRQSALRQTQLGYVRESKFACPLAAACSLVANPWPVSASVTQRGLVNPTTASGTPFTGASSAGQSDEIMLWAGDAALGAASYDIHFYLKTVTRNFYTLVGNVSLPDESGALLFRVLRSQLICPKVTHPDYVMPCPWTP
jgi:hypothetical protein